MKKKKSLIIVVSMIVAFASAASADAISAVGSDGPNWNVSCPGGNPNTCVIGDPTVFGIQSATVSVTNTGTVSADILMNYGDPTLTPFSDVGLILSPADVIIMAAGGLEYALVLNGHNGLVGGGFYSITGTKTAQTVLGNPGGVEYRNDLPVWADPTGATLLGTGTVGVTVVGNGTTGPKYNVSVTDITGGATLYDAGNFSFEVASATCGNGVVSGATPEPGSLGLLVGGSILVVAGRRRWRANRR